LDDVAICRTCIFCAFLLLQAANALKNNLTKRKEKRSDDASEKKHRKIKMRLDLRPTSSQKQARDGRIHGDLEPLNKVSQQQSVNKIETPCSSCRESKFKTFGFGSNLCPPEALK